MPLGWENTIEQVWPKNVRIRCWVHTMRNLQAKASKERWQEFRDAACLVRDKSNEAEACSPQVALLDKYESVFPAACRRLLNDGETKQGRLCVFSKHWQYVRTTHLVERCLVEERRRSLMTRPVAFKVPR